MGQSTSTAVESLANVAESCLDRMDRLELKLLNLESALQLALQERPLSPGDAQLANAFLQRIAFTVNQSMPTWRQLLEDTLDSLDNFTEPNIQGPAADNFVRSFLDRANASISNACGVLLVDEQFADQVQDKPFARFDPLGG